MSDDNKGPELTEEVVTQANESNLADATEAKSGEGVDPENDGLDKGQTTANTTGDVLGI